MPMAGTKQIRIVLSEEQYAELKEAKDGRTWKDVLIDGANQ